MHLLRLTFRFQLSFEKTIYVSLFASSRIGHSSFKNAVRISPVRTMKRFPSRYSRCWLSSRTDMSDNKRDAGDNRSPDSDDFCQSSRIFGRRCPAAIERLAGRVRFRPMKPFLNVLRQFGEIHLKDSCFSSKHNPVPFDAANRRIFAYLAVNGFEVLRTCE